MSDLRMEFFGGEENYAGVFATNMPKETAEKQPEYAGFYNVTSPTDDRSGSFTVAEGIGFLMGGIGNWENGEVPNASLSVTSPSGVVIDTATAPSAAGQVVLLPTETQPSGSVYAFMISNPEPGTWSVTVGDENDSDHFQVAVTTIPSGGGTAMVQAFEQMIQQNQTDEGFASSASATSSWQCTACKCVAYPLALLVAGAVAGGLTLLTAESTVVTALIAFISLGTGAVISAAAAIALITGLATMGVLTVGFILTSLCEWAGLCEA